MGSPDVYQLVGAIINSSVKKTAEIPPMFGGEDFAHCLEDAPGEVRKYARVKN